MRSIFDHFEVDIDLVQAGVWIEIEIGGEDYGRIKLRPADVELNDDFRRGMANLRQQVDLYKQEHDGEEVIPRELDDKLMAELYADSVVVDWGLIDREGNEIVFSREAVVEMLTHPSMAKFFTFLQVRARTWGSYRKQYEEELVND